MKQKIPRTWYNLMKLLNNNGYSLSEIDELGKSCQYRVIGFEDAISRLNAMRKDKEIQSQNQIENQSNLIQTQPQFSSYNSNILNTIQSNIFNDLDNNTRTINTISQKLDTQNNNDTCTIQIRVEKGKMISNNFSNKLSFKEIVDFITKNSEMKSFNLFLFPKKQIHKSQYEKSIYYLFGDDKRIQLIAQEIHDTPNINQIQEINIKKQETSWIKLLTRSWYHKYDKDSLYSVYEPVDENSDEFFISNINVDLRFNLNGTMNFANSSENISWRLFYHFHPNYHYRILFIQIGNLWKKIHCLTSKILIFSLKELEIIPEDLIDINE